jgi:succinate dehydrogenase / fumarate reductase membrane anchor subunit
MSQSILSSSTSGPRPGENTWLWLTKIVTGPLLLLILGLHFTVNHYMGSMPSGLMTYDDVIAYFQNPVIVAIEILFLVTVVTHSLIGFHGILLDMHPSRNILMVFTWLHVLLGVSAVLYGIWLALTIASLGR